MSKTEHSGFVKYLRASHANDALVLRSDNGNMSKPPLDPRSSPKREVVASSPPGGVESLHEFRLLAVVSSKASRENTAKVILLTDEQRQRLHIRQKQTEEWKALVRDHLLAPVQRAKREVASSPAVVTNVVPTSLLTDKGRGAAGPPLLGVFAGGNPTSSSPKVLHTDPTKRSPHVGRRNGSPLRFDIVSPSDKMATKGTRDAVITSKAMELRAAFDSALQKQQAQHVTSFSETNQHWMPHSELTFLFREWTEFLFKWYRRAGATPSSLMCSFLCTMLIDESMEEGTATTLSRHIMHETLEIMTDLVYLEEPQHEARTLAQDSCNIPEEVKGCITYTGFCYLLKGISQILFPTRDPLAAVNLLVVSLKDRYHRVHY